MLQQGGLFLDSGDRNPEVPVPVHTERVGDQVSQHVSDIGFRNRGPFHRPNLPRFQAVRQELERTNAVTAQGSQQAHGIDTFRTHTLRQPFAQAWVVRKQIVEDGQHWCSEVAIFPKRQREYPSFAAFASKLAP